MEIKNTLAPAQPKQKELSFSESISSPSMQVAIANSILDKKQRERFITNIISYANTNDKIKKCPIKEVVTAALQGEVLGLSLSPSLGESMIATYGVGSTYNPSTKEYDRYSASFQIMTNGYIQLAMRTGAYEELTVICVKEGEMIGLNEFSGREMFKFITDYDEREQRPVIGYLATYKLLNGFRESKYMSKSQVIKEADEHSPAFSKELYFKYINNETLDYKEKKSVSGSWYKHFDKMAQNMVIRRLLSKAPKSTEMRTYMERTNDFGEESFANGQGKADVKEFLIEDTTVDIDKVQNQDVEAKKEFVEEVVTETQNSVPRTNKTAKKDIATLFDAQE